MLDARTVGPKRSGIGNYVEALVPELVRAAEDLELILLRQPSAADPIVDNPRVRQEWFRGETKSVATVFGLGRVARRSTGVDLYHSPADLVPLGLSCPFVVTIHDLMWLEAPRLASGFLPVRVANRTWYSTNIARAITGARVVIAISHATADAIRRLFPDHAHKLCVIHHGLDRARYAPERVPARRHIDSIVPPGVRYSLIVGQGSPYKNHAAMIRAFVEAFGADPSHRLVLVRRFSRVDREMRALLSREDVQRVLIAVPFVDDETLLALYGHARMLLFASRYEGFGLPALEAMALGTPVLASTAPAVMEVTGSAALHAVANDPVDLARRMWQLDSDETLREQLIATGRQRAGEFSWERAGRETIAAYRRALNSGS